jgi:hypothetical protein
MTPTHIVCICGSMKSYDVMQQAAVAETLAGHIVVMPFVVKTEALSEEDHAALDNLHFEKISMSDEVLIVAVGGYVGESTRREISFASQIGKHVRWWGP